VNHKFLWVILCLTTALLVGGQVHHHRKVEVERFVRDWFRLPAEAVIVRAERHHHFPMGGEWSARFTLPPTRNPAQWLRWMAVSRRIEGHQKSRFLYEAGGDLDRLEYFPFGDYYEAEYRWD
jgi:hypothetical protein